MLRVESSGSSGGDVFSKQNIDKLLARENAEIVDVSLAPFSTEKLGFIGAYKLLTIELRERNEKLQKVKKMLTLFVKSVKPDSNPYEDMVFKEECVFYRDFAPRCLQYTPANPWIARCYLARDDLIVLEDLKAQGFKVIKRELTLNELRAAIGCVARFHASSMLLERKLKKALSRVYEGCFEDKTYIVTEGESLRTWVTTGIEVAEAVAASLKLEPRYVWQAYRLTMEGMKAEVDRGANVLCHGDLWCNNVMFREDGKDVSCRLIDFQLVFYASYAIDLVQFVYYNTRSGTRRKYLKDILTEYHAVLAQTLRDNGFEASEILSLDQVCRDYKRKRVCGLVTAVQCLPVLTLNETMAKEYFAHFERYLLVSRKDFVLDGMRMYPDYRERIEEAVEELIEYMKSSCICA